MYLHEFSAACSIVDTALEAAKSNNAIKVNVVNIEIGEFTFLIPEQLAFNFEIASKNTIAEGAELRIKNIKGKLLCSDCGFEGESRVDPDIPPQIAVFAPMKCPKCGSSSTTITGGKDFIITNIEAEIPDSTI
ncbi:hydrogenase maturation nickel metallochaperone HypA [Candidatus Thorarchaeota archaeon]|nr:MAG: hydrogenase maturation nickel metallochaperone HypA [Candidatus Thorarchaeota archaeon]